MESWKGIKQITERYGGDVYVNAEDGVFNLNLLFFVREEKLTENDIVDSFVANRRNKSLKPYFDVYFEISSYRGKLTINEPDRCSELRWCDINNLPEDMIDFEIEAIKNNLMGIKFSVIDTDNEKKLVLKK